MILRILPQKIIKAASPWHGHPARETPQGGSPPAPTSLRSRSAAALLAALFVLGTPACRYFHHSPNDHVWAEVNGQPIMRDQVQKIYSSRIASNGQAGDQEEALSYKLNILDELINKQVLLEHASHSGITISSADVDSRMAQIKSPYSEKEFKEKLSQRGMTEGDLRRQVRNDLILAKLMDRDVNSRLKITDDEIADYYRRNKAAFDVPETEYHLAQIEVTPRAEKQVSNLKNDDAKNVIMAKRKIEALHAQLQHGEDFTKVAQEYSEDPATASTGGDMGFVPASSLEANPQLKRVVLSLKVGQISSVIETQNGYHIVRLLGIEHAGQQTLDDPKVESTIRKTLSNEKEQLLKAAYIEDLRDKAKVVNYLAQRIVQQGTGAAE